MACLSADDEPLTPQAPPAFHVAPHFGGLSAFLTEEHFSDIQVRLPGGGAVAAHRVLLAAASGVLKAKFIAKFSDSQEQTWSPDVGSAEAWQWLVGWIYGRGEPLPTSHLVELLVLADHFQITALIEGIRALPYTAAAEEVADQILDAWACPDVLAEVAKQCVPTVTIDKALLGRLQAANLPNLALFLRHMPCISEVERFRLLGASLRSGDDEGSHREFADCCFHAIRWEVFPTEALEAAVDGSFKVFEELLGLPIKASENAKAHMLKALVRRCRGFEKQLPHNCLTHLSVQPFLAPPEPSAGLFAWMLKNRPDLEVLLSSAHECNRKYGPHVVLSPDNLEFGTNQQTTQHAPWIELKSENLRINPQGVGLKHGWTSSDICRSFVIEAAAGNSHWTELLSFSNRPLSTTGEVLRIPPERSAGRYFNRFRIRMTGPTSTCTWFLMVAWFDVFGTTKHIALTNLFGQATQSSSQLESLDVMPVN